jgi:NAD(P)H-dependent FMN reductase
MAQPLKIKVISGSVRDGRFSEKAAAWITDLLKQQEGLEVELLDLKDYEMPFFNEAATPNYKQKPYEHPVVVRWTAKIAEADGFVMVAPEYNHGPSAVLKNAIDWVGPEWNKKPVAFVSYGSVGGARAVEQLRLNAVEVQMVNVRQAVHIFYSQIMPVLSGQTPIEELWAGFAQPADAMIEQLVWWAQVLKAAR